MLSTAGLTQAGVITATSLDVTNSAGNVVLDQTHLPMLKSNTEETSVDKLSCNEYLSWWYSGQHCCANTAGLTQTGVITATSLDVTTCWSVALTKETHSPM